MTAKKTASVAGSPRWSPVLPKTPITLNGHEFFLVFSFNAIARLEAETGLNGFSTFDFGSITVTALRAMLYAALLEENPEIDIDTVGNLMSVETRNLDKIYTAVLQAWNASRPQADKDENPTKAEERKKHK